MEKINAEVFVTVAALGSYRKAADKLGYTQAGISYIISTMEEQAGFRFFEREYGGVRLTPDGNNLLPAMQQLYQYEKNVDQQIDKIKGLDTGHITLLSINTVIVCYLPDILNRFKQKHPGIDINLIACDSPARAVKMIKNNEADCAFVPIKENDQTEIHLLTEILDVAVVSETHPMAKAKMFPMKELENYPYIGCPEDEDPYVYEMARKLNIKLNQIMTVNNDYGCFSMISQNLGFGIYPSIMVEKSMFPVKGIPIQKGFTTPISLAVRSRDSISLAAKAFVDHVLDSPF